MEQQEYNQPDTVLFVKVGILVLSMIVLGWLGMKIIPEAVTVSNIGRRIDLPIYSVETPENRISLTLDTAWGNENLDNILEILDDNKIKATFFMTGEWVDQYPEEVKKIAAAGHDLGNHSLNHRYMSHLSEQDCRDEIMETHKRVKELTGIEMSLFRAPYGEYSNELLAAARESGYLTIQWDIDSRDWKDYGVDDILNRTAENQDLNSGSIIRLHVGAKHTPEALGTMIDILFDKGYEIVPISELIYTGNYTLDHAGRQFKK